MIKVLKFGGSSVGTYERMFKVLDIVTQIPGRKIVVLSAMGKTTNKLKVVTAGMERGDFHKARYDCALLKGEYMETVANLLNTSTCRAKGIAIIEKYFSCIQKFVDYSYSEKIEKIITAKGELISTELFHLLCEERQVKSVLLPALDFVKINEEGLPNLEFTQKALLPLLEEPSKDLVYVTQGYICRNSKGEVDNLGRGGSDYTATILGAVLKAEEVQIWTDIDGIHNNDPRFVDRTKSVPNLSYDQASMLAHFGAKILHPESVIPVKKEAIPLKIKNTFKPEKYGTLICQSSSSMADCVISVKENEMLLTIQSNNTLSSNKFLFKIIEALGDFEIDMISIAHHTVGIVMNDQYDLGDVIFKLMEFGEITTELGYSIIGVIGKFHQRSNNTLKQVFSALQNIQIRMISQKREQGYLLLLINSEDKVRALQLLNDQILNNKLPIRLQAVAVG